MTVLLLVPLFTAGAIGHGWRFLQARKQGRKPVSEKLLRPPGESLRLRIDSLLEAFDDQLTLLVGVSVAIAALYAVYAPGEGPWLFAGALLASLGCAGFFGYRLICLVRELQNHRLGFAGERAVGQALDQLLLRQGCDVFHDFPAANDWNIDHVVITPAAVYAVETKTRRKRPGPADSLDHQVTLDGDVLRFPDWNEREFIPQAQRNAAWLSEFLTKQLAEDVPVVPVLVLPGWFVERRAKSSVRVVTTKELKSTFDFRPKPGWENGAPLRRRLAAALEERCRTVEF
ncbi:MAG: NERD domain-containing protein [Verrucomicrobia bacterium]|nr:NERD domain-containing protein [Verrucomicrobiota bacterium]